MAAPFAARPEIVMDAVPSSTNRPPREAKRARKLQAIEPEQRAALWRYLRVLGAASVDADDLVQEAFLVALRRPDFDDSSPAAVFTFLRTTARQLWLRSHKRTVNEQQLREADEVWDRRCGDGMGGDYVDALQQCLSTLPERSRQLLQSTYAEGVGRSATAKRFGMRLDGVKSALRRLRGWLHSCITRRLHQLEMEDRS